MVEMAALTWRQYRLERRLFWRNPSAAFFNFLLPLLLLACIGVLAQGNQHLLNIIVPGMAGIGVTSTTFTALAYNMTSLRELGILKRIRGTPMPAISYLGGIAAHAVTNAALQVAIIIVAGRVFFGTGWPRDWPELVVFVTAGVICFAALGVAFSHVIPNYESAPAYVNAVFLPLMLVSGAFYDAARAPGFIKGIAQALPLKHLIDGLSGAMVRSHAGLEHNISALGVIVAWAVLGVALAVRGFSWQQRHG